MASAFAIACQEQRTDHAVECWFRPAKLAAFRWTRVWLAEQRGTVVTPISVVRVDDGYAVRDGHHCVSVARGADRSP